MRDYPALTITWTHPVSPERTELILAELDGFDVNAVEELPDGGVRLFFATSAARERAVTHLSTLRGLDLTRQEISDADWGARSQAAIGAVTVGALTIAPPWAVTPELRAKGDRLITIVPSMGFGTGHHQSTRLCLQHLQDIAVDGLRVLDVGTGSGVLAIAAARLGAKHVIAIDLDTDAIANAKDNVGLNGVSDRVDLREVPLADTQLLGTFDVIVANLTGGHLMREAKHLRPLAEPHADLIASGFQTDESDAVIRAIEDAGWTLSTAAAESTWIAARFTRR